MSRNEDGEERRIAPPHGRFWWLILLKPYMSAGDPGEGLADPTLDLLEPQVHGLVLYLVRRSVHGRLDLLAQEVEHVRVSFDGVLVLLLFEHLAEGRLHEAMPLPCERQEAQPHDTDQDRVDDGGPEQYVAKGEAHAHTRFECEVVAQAAEVGSSNAWKQRPRCDCRVEQQLRRGQPLDQAVALRSVLLGVPERRVQVVAEVVRV